MSAVKHTPAPWSVRKEAGSFVVSGPRTVSDEIFYQSGSRSYPEFVTAIQDTNVKGVAEPNARLISAAPELLEALEEAYRFITQPKRMMGDAPTVLTYETHDYNTLTGQLRAAIAKATGAAS